jgi:plasmid stabilization system protein ParE
MVFAVDISDTAKSEIHACVQYLTEYDEEFALAKNREIARFLVTKLPEAPYIWNYFFLTGAPYRAYLYRIGRRTQYWIVYYVNEETQVIEVLRFWNASQNPSEFEI